MSDAVTATPLRRPLTEAEVRDLEAELREVERRRSAAPKAALFVGAGIIASLWALTLVASDAPAIVVTAFWLVVGGGIILWIRRDLTRELAGTVEPLRSALRRREADVYRVEATTFAEFVEVEDEGAAYAFQVAPDRLFFLVGQEFYPTEAFPSLAFSLVYPLTESGSAASLRIASDGSRTPPDRLVRGSLKWEVEEFPQALETRVGTIDGIESALGLEGSGLEGNDREE